MYTYSSQLYLHSDIYTYIIHSSIHALIFTEPIRTTICPGALSLRNVLLDTYTVRTPQMSEKHVIGPAVSTRLYSTRLYSSLLVFCESRALPSFPYIHRYTGKELILIGGQSRGGGGGGGRKAVWGWFFAA